MKRCHKIKKIHNDEKKQNKTTSKITVFYAKFCAGAFSFSHSNKYRELILTEIWLGNVSKSKQLSESERIRSKQPNNKQTVFVIYVR